MCFSAEASFVAGSVLTVLGVVALKKTKAPAQRSFAAIPFFFGLQQVTEGFLWLGFTRPGFAGFVTPMTYVFIFFAQVVWPLWVPWSIMRMEPKDKRRTGAKVLVAVGVLVGVFLAYCLAMYPVKANAEGMHIAYRQDYPGGFLNTLAFLYVAATIAPPFFSRVKGMWLLGTSIMVSYLITLVFYSGYVLSVWCFFASIISLLVVGILHRVNRAKIL